MASVNKNFKVKNGIDVLNGAVVIPNAPTDATHAANKGYVDTIAQTVGVGPTGPAGTYEVAPTPPANPDEGDIWYDELTGASYLYYDNFWVEIGGPQGPTGPQGVTGPQGAGLTILGQYATLQELTTADPTGSAGEAYLVGPDLYVWDSITAGWVDVGNIQGPSGIISVTGPLTNTGTNSSAVLGINASSANTNNFVVQRDGSGNFIAGTVTANLTGDVTGNLIGNSTVYQTTTGSINSRKKIFVANPTQVGPTGAGLVGPATGDLWFW